MEAKDEIEASSTAAVQASSTAAVTSSAPNTSKPAPAAPPSRGVCNDTNNAAAAAVSKGNEGDLVKQELMLAPSPKRPREVEDWLLHPPDGSVSTVNQILRTAMYYCCGYCCVVFENRNMVLSCPRVFMHTASAPLAASLAHIFCCNSHEHHRSSVLSATSPNLETWCCSPAMNRRRSSFPASYLQYDISFYL